jgi:hypothetical protein
MKRSWKAPKFRSLEARETGAPDSLLDAPDFGFATAFKGNAGDDDPGGAFNGPGSGAPDPRDS